MMKSVFKREIIRNYYKREIVEYPEGLVKFESSTPGNYDVDLEDGQYEIICVGGGGAGAYTHNNAHGSGGSGGYSNQTMSLTKDTYSATVGSGGTSVGYTNPGSGTGTWSCNGSAGSASSFYSVSATGGGGGHAEFTRAKMLKFTVITFAGTGGAGGTGITQNGNAGGGTPRGQNPSGVYAGGASVYNGYGAGGNSNTVGGAGYVKITCFSEEAIVPGTAEDYDFYEDIIINNYKVCQLEDKNGNMIYKAFKDY